MPTAAKVAMMVAGTRTKTFKYRPSTKPARKVMISAAAMAYTNRPRVGQVPLHGLIFV
jgi:hypothetical protein